MTQQLDVGDGRQLAFEKRSGREPTVVFLPGFRSDMSGTKASFLGQVCAELGQGYVRFDYRGHGLSSGRFEDGTIGCWKADALAILDRVVAGPAVLVGSSMGGWIALLVALERPDLVRGLVLVAPAPDFTERLLWQRWDPATRRRLLDEGVVREPSAYGEPSAYTRALIEDGRHHLLLDRDSIPVRCPAHILHGQKDTEVPVSLSLELAAKLESPYVTVELVEDGDHRLSRSEDLERLRAALVRILEAVI